MPHICHLNAAVLSLSSKGLQMVLSVEDVSSPSGVRSMRRVAQAFPDGTLLLELSRPPKGPFGFLISRGKGRPDSGTQNKCFTLQPFTPVLVLKSSVSMT